MTSGNLVETDRGLEQVCRKLSRCGVLGFDTEFIRTRTFYPKLGLVQITDGSEAFLIDPLAVSGLDPLARILRDKSIVKVFYSCSEDIEVLYQRCGVVPQTVFDAQVGAALIGHDYTGGYQGLVAALLGVELSKHSTRTDWIKRPLSAAQLQYAGEDVEHLIPLYHLITEKLEQLGRADWLREICHGLEDESRLIPDPDNYYRRLRQAPSLRRRELGTLKALCAWRENEAMGRDCPRNHIIRDETLAAISRHPPKNKAELGAARNMHLLEVRRNGERILQVIESAHALPDDKLPESLAHRRHTPEFTANLKALREGVNEKAAELEIPTELLAPRRALEDLLANASQDGRVTLPPALSGWRKEIIGEAVLARATAIVTS